MGCTTSVSQNIIQDNEEEKELAYRHTIRMMKFTFDQMGSKIYLSQWSALVDLVGKTNDIISEITKLCQESVQSSQKFSVLKNHMERWFPGGESEPTPLIQSADGVEDGIDDKSRVVSAINLLHRGEEPKRNAVKTYLAEWFQQIVYMVTPFQTIDHTYLQKIQSLYENTFFELEKFPIEYSYDINEYSSLNKPTAQINSQQAKKIASNSNKNSPRKHENKKNEEIEQNVVEEEDKEEQQQAEDEQQEKQEEEYQQEKGAEAQSVAEQEDVENLE